MYFSPNTNLHCSCQSTAGKQSCAAANLTAAQGYSTAVLWQLQCRFVLFEFIKTLVRHFLFSFAFSLFFSVWFFGFQLIYAVGIIIYNTKCKKKNPNWDEIKNDIGNRCASTTNQLYKPDSGSGYMDCVCMNDISM